MDNIENKAWNLVVEKAKILTLVMNNRSYGNIFLNGILIFAK